MPSFQQPRPRPGFLIDTSSSMEDSQLARALAELAGTTAHELNQPLAAISNYMKGSRRLLASATSTLLVFERR